MAVVAGAYGGFEYRRWSTAEGTRSGGASLSTTDAEAQRKAAAEAALQRQAALDAERAKKEKEAAEAARQAALEADRVKKEKEAAEARQRQAALEAERRQKEAADARQRQIEIEEARRRKELADAAEAEARRKAEAAAEAKRKEEAEARRKAEAAAEAKRKEEQRIAALAEARRKDRDRHRGEAPHRAWKKRVAAATNCASRARPKPRRSAASPPSRRRAARSRPRPRTKLREERRIAALEETRRTEEKRKEDERLRLAAIPDDDKRAEFVRKIQLVLKRSRCYDGAVTGRSNDAQDGLDKFVDTAQKRGKPKPTRIELAKATVGDFETWLKDADAVKDGLCVPVAKPAEKPAPVQGRGGSRRRQASSSGE